MKEVFLIFVIVLFGVLLYALFCFVQITVRKKRYRQERKKALSRMTDAWFKVYCDGLTRVKVSRCEKKFINQEIKRRKLKIELL